MEPKIGNFLEMEESKRPTWKHNMDNKKNWQSKGRKLFESYDTRPERHINKTTGETYKLLIIMKVAFIIMDEEMLRELTVSVLRSRFEYVIVIWSSYEKKHIRKLKRI